MHDYVRFRGNGTKGNTGVPMYKISDLNQVRENLEKYDTDSVDAGNYQSAIAELMRMRREAADLQTDIAAHKQRYVADHGVEAVSQAERDIRSILKKIEVLNNYILLTKR